ncbi:MAG: serine protease [Anaerolineae bacterium]
MKQVKITSLSLLIALLLLALGSQSGLALERGARQNVLHAAVQIVALNLEGKSGSTAWTGSGTIVDPNGLILTNYHVVEENGEWNKLGVAITTQSDQPPQPTYFAEIAAKAPRLDLAVLRIVSDLDGQPFDPAAANLAYVPLGSADSLEVGDELNIFGYPGIGGATITFTKGEVSGFVNEEGVDYPRAWIKTDATIAGGNSGGTAVDETGFLTGIPTKLGAGNTDYFADVRPIQDTNGDGVVDENDTPISLGGFLNSLRPVNLAYPLIEAARSGEQIEVEANPGQPQQIEAQPAPQSGLGSQPEIGSIIFATQQKADGLPKDPNKSFPAGITQLLAYFDYQGMQNDADFNYVWTLDEVTIASNSLAWDGDSQGTYLLSLDNGGDPMPEGTYKLVLGQNGALLQGGAVTVGQTSSPNPQQPPAPQPPAGNGVTLSGQIVDADTGRGISAAFMVILQPGFPVNRFFAEEELPEGALSAFAITDEQGIYTTLPPLARGDTYGVVIYAQGYEPIALDDALEILANDPDQVDMETIALSQR